MPQTTVYTSWKGCLLRLAGGHQKSLMQVLCSLWGFWKEGSVQWSSWRRFLSFYPGITVFSGIFLRRGTFSYLRSSSSCVPKACRSFQGNTFYGYEETCDCTSATSRGSINDFLFLHFTNQILFYGKGEFSSLFLAQGQYPVRVCKQFCFQQSSLQMQILEKVSCFWDLISQ